ncbi:MAG TPA: porin [Ferruginibacter sp.]|nr:porin [Ferruginibacter sp.]
MSRKLLLIFCFLCIYGFAHAQFLMDMVDTTTETGRGILSVYKKYDHLRFTGYIQPQYQLAGEKGSESFEGGDFSENVSSRFMLRRSRVRIDYVHYYRDDRPGVQFVFQFDANERSFTVRDVWGRLFENKYKLFSFTTGMFARPFGYEVNLSSSDRESPERGRMSQIMMRSERDLGAMATFDARKKVKNFNYLKIDAGVFNGQGINAAGDFDNHKDFIGRVSLKPYPLSKKMTLSAGGSVLIGGLENNTRYHYTTVRDGNGWKEQVDSSLTNIGRISKRRYFGADAQWKIANKKGFTELRAEFIAGTQTGTALSPETPNKLPEANEGFHERRFSGAYFYFLQHIFSSKHQLLVKYDWYDPNSRVSGMEIGRPGSNLGAANIRYQTLGLGYIYYMNENAKLVLYYAMVHNEKTSLPGFDKDLDDNVFTCRLQFRF